MRTFFGIVLIVTGIAVGLYLGVWVMFIGGITQILQSLNPVIPVEVGVGVFRILAASLVGWFSFGILAGTGKMLIK